MRFSCHKSRIQMRNRVASILHLFPPQRCHLLSNQTISAHPVCLEVADYCAKIDKLVPTQVPVSAVRLPVLATIPASAERYVFDEIIADDMLFRHLHGVNIRKEIQLFQPRETIDNLACEIVAGAHHGTSKLVLNCGAASSGHGLLLFGAQNHSKIPQVSLLNSILDALSGEVKVACFQVEGQQLRDLLTEDRIGTLIKPRTENGLVTIQQLYKCGLEFKTLNAGVKKELFSSVYSKRRVLAKWHAIARVIDRTIDGKAGQFPYPLLSNVNSQVGYQNHGIAMDVCAPTCVLLQLGEERQFANILIVDLSTCAANSSISAYTPAQSMGDCLKQAAAIKLALANPKNNKDHLITKLLAGVCTNIFDPTYQSISRDVYQLMSLQVSDFERQQSFQNLRFASAVDPAVSERFFEAYEAELRRVQLEKHVNSQFQNEPVDFSAHRQPMENNVEEQDNQQDNQEKMEVGDLGDYQQKQDQVTIDDLLASQMKQSQAKQQSQKDAEKNDGNVQKDHISFSPVSPFSRSKLPVITTIDNDPNQAYDDKMRELRQIGNSSNLGELSKFSFVDTERRLSKDAATRELLLKMKAFIDSVAD